MTGEFFAVGIPQFQQACQLGMNPAIAFLVMARGTQGDNRTTRWSAYAVFNYTGLARRRATAAIEDLVGAGLVEVLQRGKLPKYRLQKSGNDADLVWIPNTIIDGAGNEIPPITKLRERGNLQLLEKFIKLYHEQDLESDGGIPRTIARTEFQRERIGDIGPFTLYGFKFDSQTANAVGIFTEYAGQKDDEGNCGAWMVLHPLEELGLLQHTFYMAESANYEAELLYPITEETQAAIEQLWEWAEQMEMHGFLDKREQFDHFAIATRHIKEASLVGCLRLHYRPHTSKTSRWWAMEKEKIEAMVGLINHSCSIGLTPLRANQG